MSTAADWLSDEFLASVKRRANVPTSSESWDDDDILKMATDEMRDSLVPMLRRVNEEFLVDSYDQSTTAGTASYDLPNWATGEALRDVQLSDGNGGYFSLTRREPHDVLGSSSGSPGEFWLDDDKVVLIPTPSSVLTLRLRCIRRPGRLVSIAKAFAYVSETVMQTTISPLDGESSAATELSGVTSFDVIRARAGFRTLGTDVSGSVATATLLNISGGLSSVVTTVTAGDYIVEAGTSPAPQIPVELHGLLAQQTACAYLRASGQPGLDSASAKLAEMKAEALMLFTPRTQNQPRHIVNKHGAGYYIRRRGF